MRRLAPLVLLLLLLAAPQAGAAQREVSLGNGIFVPDAIQIEAGDTILFVNDDDRAHTVTSVWDDGASLHVILKPGQSVPVVFHEAGTYAIRCLPHSTVDHAGAHGMAMTLEVQGAAAEEASSRWTVALVALGLVALGAMAWYARGLPLRRWLRG